VTTVLLLRHGRSTANSDGVLAGWTPGVSLDERGREQADDVAKRLADLPLAAVVSSPLERCQAMVQPLLKGRAGLPLAIDDRLGECRYGDWTGRQIKELAKDKLWRVVQAHPSAVTFPGAGGESLRDMQQRAVAAIRDWDIRLTREAGPDAVWLACSHGDVIKAVVADALGLHLDLFQRITVDPGSVTAIRYTKLRPFLIRLNDVAGDASAYQPPSRPAPQRASQRTSRPAEPRRRRARSGSGADRLSPSDAIVGGGTG
jgi:probable phosphomutase (TIGR03848 family)